LDDESVLRIYNERYALTYDDRFLHGEPWTRVLSQYMEEVLRDVMPRGGSWLDVGCGTGWYLSRFPDVERAGLDLSPAMLEVAARRNPHVPLTQGNFLDDTPEWNGRWDLVTNLWFAYQHVSSMRDAEDVIARHASWVSPAGTLIVHVGDSEDIHPHTAIPWESRQHGGSVFVTAIMWSWKEADGTRHDDLVAPQLQRMVNIIARHFDDIEVRWWPRTEAAPRYKAVIARKKRRHPRTSQEVGDNYPFTSVYPPPEHPMEAAFDRRIKEASAPACGSETKIGSNAELSAISSEKLLRELAHRTRSGRLFTAAARRLIRRVTRR
jgi:SAM-dependent methyltransferase